MHRSIQFVSPIAMLVAVGIAGDLRSQVHIPVHVNERQRSPKLPEDVILLLDKHDQAVEKTRSTLAEQNRNAESQCKTALASAAERHQRAGEYQQMKLVEEQAEALDREVEGLSVAEQRVVDTLRSKKKDLDERAQADLDAEREQTLRQLRRAQSRETSAMHREEADAIQVHIDELDAEAKRIEAERLRARCRKTLIGTWAVTVKSYTGVWSFTDDGRVTATATTMDGKSISGNEGTWELRDDDVFVQWSSKPQHWETFHFPIEPKETIGDSHLGDGALRAVKRKA